MNPSRPNCWEVKNCGRQPGGDNVGEQGACPASTDLASDGLNGGRNGGRICWTVAGTLCEGKASGNIAARSPSCGVCDFLQAVRREEGESFVFLRSGRAASSALFEHFNSIVSIIDSINAIVYAADLQTYEMLFLNSYGASLFGQDCVGKPCYQVLQVGQTAPCSFCTNHRLIENGKAGPPVIWEFQNTVTGRWFLCIDKAIPWWDGRLVRMEVAVDITDRKEAERFREEYVGLVSHDLRNPLNSIMLRAQILQRSLQGKGLSQEAQALDGLIASATRMDRLIGDLVDTTRLESGRLELEKSVVDLREMVARVVSRIACATDRDRVEVRKEDEPVRVVADPDRLERVVENLVSNALKFSSKAPVAVAVQRQEGDAVLSVRDQGVGVPAAELPRLFQRFYRATTASAVKGSGLGLYHARLIVEAHGGRISAESEAGKGATFRVALPLAPD